MRLAVRTMTSPRSRQYHCDLGELIWNKAADEVTAHPCFGIVPAAQSSFLPSRALFIIRGWEESQRPGCHVGDPFSPPFFPCRSRPFPSLFPSTPGKVDLPPV
jgi:hypothetical protein